ncbi:MAG: cytochrome c biogenesis protein ResB [Candidatus Omnitrophica bacterium]|nr:cytochrome c biogenesis protein ResB [Candidatus Omnitrophota bacterium]
MTTLFSLLGSLRIAVFLIIAIACVLGWGTIYEVRFGTAAVQRFVYQSWWFQGILSFLAVNLMLAALKRLPWKRAHTPFLLAHLGIILILLGGIAGGIWAVDGQLVIPEGEKNDTLRVPQSVIVVHKPNPGTHHVIPVAFETQAWVHEPHTLFSFEMEGKTMDLVVDRYYPNSQVTEEINAGGEAPNPAVHLMIEREGVEDAVWLLARHPERFGVGWGDAHVLFMEVSSREEWARMAHPAAIPQNVRGVVRLEFPDLSRTVEVPVPEELKKAQPIEGTPYTIAFQDYFADFVISESGPVSRSNEPQNPAVAFTLTGPEGTDPHILFAFHPEFASLHVREYKIHVHAEYIHEAGSSLPPNSIVLFELPQGELAAIMTGAAAEREMIEAVEPGKDYAHPWAGIRFQVAAHYPKAQVIESMTNKGDEVRNEAIHVMVRDGENRGEAWLGQGETKELALGQEKVLVEYRQAERPLPFLVALKDFRKLDYPGTQMAAGFESDVALTDPSNGVTLERTIRMNNPLKYRGFSLFQSSWIDGPVQTTVLSVRNDPGTPLVYSGFIIVVVGIVSLFVRRARTSKGSKNYA